MVSISAPDVRTMNAVLAKGKRLRIFYPGSTDNRKLTFTRWCGTGYYYCSAPACQFDYGPHCDANRRPKGANTEDWPRDHVGSVPYGEAIYHCTKPGTVALTFDDGPWDYTERLLDILEVRQETMLA